MKKKGFLVLATGQVFTGRCFGSLPKEGGSLSSGEVVFNTSLTGYQEILTDPSYQGQIVLMTASHIGNYGINNADTESHRIYLSGFVVQELSPVVSNWRATNSLHAYLAQAGVPGLTDVDTRAVTRLLRIQGAINGLITADERGLSDIVKKAKKLSGLEGQDLVKQVTSSEIYKWEQGSETAGERRPSRKVVVMDFGVKHHILRSLVDRQCDVTVVPATASANQILDINPDGLLLSNGPGDPAAVDYAIKTIESLIDHNQHQHQKKSKEMAMFGICLGHQLLGLALGGRTYKLKFGHHGANHPIKDLETGRVDITAQNHGFAVEGEKMSSGQWVVKGNKDALVTHINLNDNAIEGLRHKTLPIFSVQYHPEASAGPHDANHLFDRFMTLMDSAEKTHA